MSVIGIQRDFKKKIKTTIIVNETRETSSRSKGIVVSRRLCYHNYRLRVYKNEIRDEKKYFWIARKGNFGLGRNAAFACRTRRPPHAVIRFTSNKFLIQYEIEPFLLCITVNSYVLFYDTQSQQRLRLSDDHVTNNNVKYHNNYGVVLLNKYIHR